MAFLNYESFFKRQDAPSTHTLDHSV